VDDWEPTCVPGRFLKTMRGSAIDSATMNFACRANTGDRFYWVARNTRFRAGRSNASFFDLRTGQPVRRR
jgi:hypothetical protein